jgi:hypothetical protein
VGRGQESLCADLLRDIPLRHLYFPTGAVRRLFSKAAAADSEVVFQLRTQVLKGDV